ncbi:hypothetical protein D1115_06540 [Vibrio alfacsensis]|uniref:Uncharacterized protein n=1 Tax=Vibrio alfacsensis TaxID=1074311 RepID=A0ABM6YTJ7_9VIBR|nr:hypothetical protein [Vibrio alfacsensis]AXY00936.1 hypothetical protein D1115_06540 [Vibrio alfacsensis]
MTETQITLAIPLSDFYAALGTTKSELSRGEMSAVELVLQKSLGRALIDLKYRIQDGTTLVLLLDTRKLPETIDSLDSLIEHIYEWKDHMIDVTSECSETHRYAEKRRARAGLKNLSRIGDIVAKQYYEELNLCYKEREAIVFHCITRIELIYDSEQSHRLLAIRFTYEGQQIQCAVTQMQNQDAAPILDAFCQGAFHHLTVHAIADITKLGCYLNVTLVALEQG